MFGNIKYLKYIETIKTDFSHFYILLKLFYLDDTSPKSTISGLFLFQKYIFINVSTTCWEPGDKLQMGYKNIRRTY